MKEIIIRIINILKDHIFDEEKNNLNMIMANCNIIRDMIDDITRAKNKYSTKYNVEYISIANRTNIELIKNRLKIIDEDQLDDTVDENDNTRYEVVTLCGSTKFKDDFLREQKRLTLDGKIVISVGLFGHSGDTEVWENMDDGTRTKTKEMLDEMHKRKIDMADSIHVINKNGYIGESTKSEIAYAESLGKKITYMENNKSV